MITPALTPGEYDSLGKVSGEEYTRYLYLYAMWRDGVISNLELQPAFEVLPRIVIKSPVSWYKGFTQSRVTYTPDFRYEWRGTVIIEEYKGLEVGTKRKPLKNPKPRITDASRKSIKELIAKYEEDAEYFVFVITAWHKWEHCYYAFNANAGRFDYPLANHIGE